MVRLRAVPALSSLLVLALLGTACSGVDNDGERSVVNVAPRGPGTCLDFGDEVGAEVTELPVVECAEPHSHEIFSVVISQPCRGVPSNQCSEDVYPGFDALEAEAQARCLGEFESYVGISAFDSELFYSWLVPTLTSWDQDDDREIICVVGEDNAAPLVGSVRGVAR